ncbi:MAG: glycosyltransferase family 2 protein [Patescibacteria group bacterium]|nr:glycosyltransferase family 2 protein [Patescibacteria group bacterium]
MDLTIIIPSFNTKDLLDKCLHSLGKTKYEIIVVDNNSSDGSVEMVEKKYPYVQLIKNKENVGYGKANNQGIKQARGEYILLLNSDCFVKDDGIEQLLKFGRNKDFVGGKLFNEDGSPQPSAGPFYRLPVVFLMLFFKGDQLGITRYSPNTAREVDWVSGACLLGKKQSFLDVGLFDESIFMYMEEVEFLFRAKQKGYRVWFYPNAHFIHVGAASSGNRREPVVQIYRGLDYFYARHCSPYQRALLRLFLRLKALFVMGICGIIGKRDMAALYAKALHTIS